MAGISSVVFAPAMDGRHAEHLLGTTGNVSEKKINVVNTASEVLENMKNDRIDSERLKSEIQRLSSSIGSGKLQFMVNNETKKVIVRVVNPVTNELIREIPSEDSRKIAEMMKRYAGNFFDEIV